MRNELRAPEGYVVLVLDAGSDVGYRMARDLLHAGYRVAATSRHTTRLARIMHGYSADRVMAIAADPDDTTQVHQLVHRVESRLGPIEFVVHAGDRGMTRAAPRQGLRRLVPVSPLAAEAGEQYEIAS